jgi:hypothetical protein
MHMTEKAVADVLRCHRQVHVEELSTTFIDAFAQRGIRLIRRAEAHRISVGERSIQRFSGGCAGHHTDLKRLAGGVENLRPRADGPWNILGRTGGSEPAEGHGLTVLNHLRGFSCAHLRIGVHGSSRKSFT